MGMCWLCLSDLVPIFFSPGKSLKELLVARRRCFHIWPAFSAASPVKVRLRVGGRLKFDGFAEVLESLKQRAPRKTFRKNLYSSSVVSNKTARSPRSSFKAGAHEDTDNPNRPDQAAISSQPQMLTPTEMSQNIVNDSSHQSPRQEQIVSTQKTGILL